MGRPSSWETEVVKRGPMRSTTCQPAISRKKRSITVAR